MIAGGRVSVLMHLLAPNHRPQQVTEDLRSFWNGAYADVRKELAPLSAAFVAGGSVERGRGAQTQTTGVSAEGLLSHPVLLRSPRS
jgi:HrpA-like RNA helicase